MAIFYHEDSKVFHLQSKNTSYIFQINNGYLTHAYWGKKINNNQDLSSLLFHQKDDFLDRLPQEYPQYGSGDHRSPSYQVQLVDDGSRITELIYKEHSILPGKPKLDGLPATYVESEQEADTLVITLEDSYTGLEVKLNYTVYKDFDVIARSANFYNKGEKSLKLLRALSATVDFHDSNYEALYLSGAWSREAYVQRRPLGPGTTSLDNKRGASSHQMNPFLSLVRPNTDENHGEAYGFNLVYSGSFIAEAEVDPFENTRVSIGLNPFDFSWELDSKDSFQTPEATLVYSNEGIGGLSRNYHKLYRTRLARGVHRDKVRPILVNNWEATYFDFNEDKIEEIAKVGADLGIELFVLDDGWFGKRDDDTTSLGDWFEDRKKLPNGLENLAKRVNDLGIQFGLWFEPEMISPDSELYRKHPDWCLHVPGRRRTLARTQSVLDLSRQDVQDYLFDTLHGILSRAPISYVKWDMNRFMTEIGSAQWPAEKQQEIAHRYMLGLYKLLERITNAFPNILFESCASGGGRFDPGMLYYMPQTWTSDDTDAIERQKIQYGTSIVYPVSAIGAHVSAVPNHQVGRMPPLKTRGDVAMSGNFGYELDLTKFTEEEKEIVKEQVKTYKENRSLIQQGDLYRLKSPFEGKGNETSWMFVSDDKSEAIVFYFRVLAEPEAPYKRLILHGLDENFKYKQGTTDQVYGGDFLMQAGLPISPKNTDYTSLVFKFRQVK